MNRSEYLETQAGQYWKRQLRQEKTQVFQVENHEPKSKKSMSRQEKIYFQRQIVTQMKVFGRRAYRSKVVLEIDFCSQQDNPPALHTLTKNYLDLLQQPVEGSGIDRRALLLSDDRLIQVLIANYHVRLEGVGPEICIHTDTFAHFLEDIRLLNRIRHGNFSDRRKTYVDPVWDEGNDNQREGELNRVLDELMGWERDRAEIQAVFSPEAYNGMHHALRMHVQDLYMKMFNTNLQNLLLLVAPDLWGRGGLSWQAAEMEWMRNLLITPPFMVDLAHAPVVKGDTNIFKANAETALTDFVDRHPLLFPLLTTIGVTILFTPPEKQSLDLDNLARRIIPAVHEILRPPSDIIRTIDATTIKDFQLQDWHKQRLELLARTPEQSVTQYQIIRLPRMETDPKDGFVRLALNDGKPGGGLWRRMSRILEDWEHHLSG